MNCNKCNSKNIKTRTNFSHGKSSKARKSISCADCGSFDIEVPKPSFFKRRR